MNLDLFESLQPVVGTREKLGEAAVVLRGFALPYVDEVLTALQQIEQQAPFRHMLTPGGFTMSAALTSCGTLGWISDRQGYRYGPGDPASGLAWPPMPSCFQRLAAAAAGAAGYPGFVPDACLINRYTVGARMSLHQDKNERDLRQPVVSVSLGIPAIFQFGGLQRQDKAQRTALMHGDVVVWGGVDRLRYHGILALKPAHHAVLGEQRINITFRKAG